MSTIKTSPVTWVVEKLMCDCGGEFCHVHSVKYVQKPFVHACDKCSVVEDREFIYPRTVWREV